MTDATVDLKSLVAASRPRSRLAHWLANDGGGQLLVVDGSRLFNVSNDVLRQLDDASLVSEEQVERVLASFGLSAPELISDEPLRDPPLQAISLAIAQKCNLGCTYCYADRGSFGGKPTNMDWEVARKALDVLFSQAAPASRVNVAFLGGEPLANRALLRRATEYATQLAASSGIRATFSVTTNGTLLTEEDAHFFEQYGFAVTVSLDGLRDEHDLHRRMKFKGGTFDRIMSRVEPFLRMQRRMQVSVRSTITPGNLRLREALDWFFDAGFHSVGFSPVLRSPTGQAELAESDLMPFLEAMMECGAEFERRVLTGRRYAFANMVNAMWELHRGTHRPYPCGAGAGYLGVSAKGDLAACHRFVGDVDGQMGSLSDGIDRSAQSRWLKDRHVHNQAPCRDCWARYMCGGGCHHEALGRGRTACDYIRGWLQYCLGAYDRLLSSQPGWFMNPPPRG